MHILYMHADAAAPSTAGILVWNAWMWRCCENELLQMSLRTAESHRDYIPGWLLMSYEIEIREAARDNFPGKIVLVCIESSVLVCCACELCCGAGCRERIGSSDKNYYHPQRSAIPSTRG